MRDPIRQTAGNCSITVYTGGSPLFPDLQIKAINGDDYSVKMNVNDLHDLRYCIDRVLAELGLQPK